MRLGILAFAVGVWLLQSQATLPRWSAIAVLAAAFLGALAMQRAAGAGSAAIVRVVVETAVAAAGEMTSATRRRSGV